mmetsp:Transcript_14410/g.42245  ORF Transcript_14410/g.42245 Transcript_14410/m.42245 type:complete len:125 (-) Transcript_14410:49-423(-)
MSPHRGAPQPPPADRSRTKMTQSCSDGYRLRRARSICRGSGMRLPSPPDAGEGEADIEKRAKPFSGRNFCIDPRHSILTTRHRSNEKDKQQKNRANGGGLPIKLGKCEGEAARATTTARSNGDA